MKTKQFCDMWIKETISISIPKMHNGENKQMERRHKFDWFKGNMKEKPDCKTFDFQQNSNWSVAMEANIEGQFSPKD